MTRSIGDLAVDYSDHLDDAARERQKLLSTRKKLSLTEAFLPPCDALRPENEVNLIRFRFRVF